MGRAGVDAPIDGQKAAVQLLRTLEKINWKRAAPAKSMRAVKASLRCAATFPSKEFDRFSSVISDWLALEVVGFGWNLNDYVSMLKERARHG